MSSTYAKTHHNSIDEGTLANGPSLPNAGQIHDRENRSGQKSRFISQFYDLKTKPFKQHSIFSNIVKIVLRIKKDHDCEKKVKRKQKKQS